jgi:hypothetical protein
MESTSPDMKAVMDAVAVLHQGEKERGRALLLQLWKERATSGDPLQLCAMAHSLADTEPDVADELEWDLRALEAATGCRAAEDRDALFPVPESFLASLHLNAGDCYRRLGDFERARQHAHFASNHIGALADDGYGTMIKGGLRRLQARLAAD